MDLATAPPLDTNQLGHLDVQENQVDIVLADQAHGLGRLGRIEGIEAFRFQDLVQGLAHLDLIIDDENLLVHHERRTRELVSRDHCKKRLIASDFTHANLPAIPGAFSPQTEGLM
jgi:hypothetical protein